VLITPHTAAFGADYWAPAIDLFLENMARFLRNEPLVNVVDKARGY
jgi:phosphoglycerate dehydrogenase-like enzyme